MTYKYRIYPTRLQIQKINETIYYCRFLYNNMLDHRIKCYKMGKSVRKYDQLNELREIREEFVEYKQIHSQILQNVGDRLEKAYSNFFNRIKNGSKEKGFPRFKGRNAYHSFTYPQSGYVIENNKLSLSKIGEVKIKLHRPLRGVVKTCTIICKNNQYYACLACEVPAVSLPIANSVVGIDVGVSHFVITSDGEFFEKQNSFRKNEKQIKYLQRQVSRRKKGSNRRKQAVSLLAKKHEKVANQRKDVAHKVSRYLVNNNDVIVHENLQIKNMVKNHKLAKSISDAGWGLLFQYLNYKAESAGRIVEKVDPYNTSQVCSECGKLVPKPLSERQHSCPHCGLSIHRDI
ncbi:MAG: RNA-guided endonuclease TnpB family protein, partial [Flavobacterium sp.]